jgi:hypothetical protein|tara:strand:- start:41 stop:439 length:399 start_codon:yes stop_codon:yes gene_type:complete
MPKNLPRPNQQGKAYTKEQRQEIIGSLKPYLTLGYDLKNACILAQVTYETVWEWVNKDNALLIKIKAWQNMVNAKARQNVAASINEGDTQESKWWLERKEKKTFSTRTDITSDGERLIPKPILDVQQDDSNS